jgi:two-component system, OmpR family, phosphate regulon sensor histidine kinase PhoR
MFPTPSTGEMGLIIGSASFWIGAAGALALMALAGLGLAQPGPAIAAAVALMGLAVWLAARRPKLAAPAAGRAAPQALPTSAGAALEALPLPVLIITGTERAGVADRRWIYANAAAREALRLEGDNGLVVGVLRDPEVLEAVDEALFGRVRSQATPRSAGAQDRTLTIIAQPLADGGEPHALALLTLHDETDARRSERMRADFLANASHELRTPLASLAGFIETLRGHARDDPAARDRFLGIMHAQTERMGRLVDDLLALSRIELNEHIPPADVVDLAMAVGDVVDALEPVAVERGVKLDTRLPAAGEVLAVGDRDQILQVAQNLIDNAIKFSAAGQAVRVELLAGLTFGDLLGRREAARPRASLLTPEHGPETYATLEVADLGAGIAREHLTRLSERFYRVEGQKSGPRAGTGLGLAIVKHIIARHRGGLSVESAPGAGATFTAIFPVKPQAVTKLS